MKRSLLHLFLILALFAVVHSGAAGQTADGDTRIKAGDSLSADKGDETTADTSPDGAVTPVERDGTTLDVGNEKGLEEKRKAEAKARQARRLAEKKAEERRAAEQKKQEPERTEQKQVEGGDASKVGDALLLVDHESIKYNRIPGITIKAEEPGLDIVKIPDDSVTDNEKKKPKGGIFGSHTDTIAKWGLLIFVFVVFIIYKTRSKSTRRKVVRTITKR